MRKLHPYLLGMSLLGSGISGAAHCPTHIINSSGKPWVLAAIRVQGTLKVTTIHSESGPLPRRHYSSIEKGYFIIPAHSIIAVEAPDDTMACEAQFALLDHNWRYATDCVLAYAAPAASGGPQPPEGSINFFVPATLKDAASCVIREPTPVILQILRDQWNVRPLEPDQAAADAEASS